MSEHDQPIYVDIPRSAKRGRTFVYVLPSVGEDLTKVGFTHDPVQRFRRFHPRFFALFDLEKGLLIETSQLRDARRMERLLIERWPEHRASAPLLVSEAAGGHTEWFRGITADVDAFVRRLAERYDYVLHAPLRDWLRARFAERSDELYEWSLRTLDIIEWQVLNVPVEAQDRSYAKVLRDTLDACAAVGMDLDRLVSPAVLAWRAKRDVV